MKSSQVTVSVSLCDLPSCNVYTESRRTKKRHHIITWDDAILCASDKEGFSKADSLINLLIFKALSAVWVAAF